MIRHALLAGVILCVGAAAATGQDGPAKADPPAGAAKPKLQPLKATVVSVSGAAQKRRGADPKAKWEPVKAGDVLDEMTIIRTGLAAKVVVSLADRGRVTINSATKVGIGQLGKRGDLVEARLGLKYGSMRANIETARGPNDFKVSTPVATLSVRGTSGALAYWADLGLLLCGADGTWVVDVARRRRRIYPRECTNDRLTPSIILAENKRDTRMGDPGGGTTGIEEEGLRDRGGGRGLFNAAGGTGPTVLTTTTDGTSDHQYPNGEPCGPSCVPLEPPDLPLEPPDYRPDYPDNGPQAEM